MICIKRKDAEEKIEIINNLILDTFDHIAYLKFNIRGIIDKHIFYLYCNKIIQLNAKVIQQFI